MWYEDTPWQEHSASDRVVDRLGERREELRAAFRHVPAVLHAHAELTGDVDPGLVGEAHAGLKQCAVCAHEVGRLVAVHTDAMTGAVGGTGQSIVRGPAKALVILAHRNVDVADRDAGLRGLKTDLLPALDGIPDLALALGGLAVDPGTGDVGRVAVDLAATTEPSRTVCGFSLPWGYALASFRSTRPNSCVPPRSSVALTSMLMMSGPAMPALRLA